MREVCKKRIADDTAWYADDIRNDVDAWLHQISQEQKNEVLAALGVMKKTACTVESVKKESFPLPGFSFIFEAVNNSLNNSYGFSIIRGIPVG